jgi:hypothetical protein
MVSIHAARAGGDRRYVERVEISATAKFQSTPPARGGDAPAMVSALNGASVIVSIHAARAGRRPAEHYPDLVSDRFNPRRPARGGDSCHTRHASSCVSIHAARAGGDRSSERCSPYVIVSIHAARAGGDQDGRCLTWRNVSIHAARAGGDSRRWHEQIVATVSIHAARAGGDALSRAAIVMAVSIHAARAGATHVGRLPC